MTSPTGTFYAVPTGVSDNGKVVTGFSGDAFHDWPFRWTIESSMEILRPLPPTSQYVLSQAISANGSVIVGGSLIEGPGVFRWTEETGLESLGAIGLAYAVSSNGDVIAGEADGRAFRWTEDTGLVSIGGQGSMARGISSDGSVVVGRIASGEAFRWTAESGVLDLGRLDAAGESEAMAVSADGQVVVGTSRLAEGGSLAFRWTEQTGMVALENPPGMVASEALDISADGSLVVGWGVAFSHERENRRCTYLDCSGGRNESDRYAV